MREAAQVVSYEVPLGLCVVVPVLICGTLDLVAIGNMQAGWFTNWLIFHDPFTFVARSGSTSSCAMASVNRAPFDLAEAESELVAGFHTEYSGLRWSFFFMAEYGSMLLVSGLAAILFLGGWHGPIPVFDLVGWTYGQDETAWRLPGYLANLGGCVNLLLKARAGRDRDDVGAVDAAAAADRPGDDDVLEVLRAAGGGLLSGGDGLAVGRVAVAERPASGDA